MLKNVNCIILRNNVMILTLTNKKTRICKRRHLPSKRNHFVSLFVIAMAYVPNSKTLLSEEIELKTLWMNYRKLLLDFTQYLSVTGREKMFKHFFYRCIPSKYLSLDIVDWLIHLEQSDIINMNRLEMLDYFLQSFCDSNNDKIRSTIREFQYRLHLVQGLLGSNAQLEGKLRLPTIYILSAISSSTLEGLT